MNLIRPTVGVFNCVLLSRSETFVRAQGEALQSHQAVYLGSHQMRDGLELPEERTLVVNRGGPLGYAAEALFKYTGQAPTLVRKLQRHSPRLIHAHFGFGGALALPLAEQMNLPLVVTFHGADATVRDDVAKNLSHTHRIYLRRRQRLFRSASAVICVSNFIRDKVLEQGAPAEKTVVHHIGIDTEFFESRTGVQREPVVLFVGRLVEKKGCDYVIRAMAQLHQALPEVRLKIIGDGPCRASLQMLASQL